MKKRIILSYLTAASAVLTIFLSLSNAFCGELYNLSLNAPLKNPSERIIGFELKIDSGSVYSFPRIPVGWGINIDNDPSSHTKVKGEVGVGACALGKDFLDNFVVIERGPDKEEALKVEMEVITTTDFENEKHYHFKTGDFTLQRIERKKQLPQAGSLD